MAITPKEAAEKYFQEAVAQNVQQDFGKVIELYRKALTLDPDHGGAQHNLRILRMVDLDKKAQAFMLSAFSYGEGLQDEGIPNPAQAIKDYNQAKKHYQALWNFLDDELRYIRDTKMLTPNTNNTKLARYNQMLAYNKERAKKAIEKCKDEINKLAKKLSRVGQNVVKVFQVDQNKTAYDVKSYADFINTMCEALEVLSDLYKKGLRKEGVAEFKRAEDLDKTIRCLKASLDTNSGGYAIAGNRHTTFSTPSVLRGEPPLKKQKTDADMPRGMSASS